MSSKARFILGLFLAGAIAALADPRLSAQLPEGIGSVLGVALAAVLHKMNAEAPKDESEKPE